jgi:phosphomannomutase
MSSSKSLRDSLVYEPVPLKFGTSGRRGLVRHLTQLEVYLNALAELEYLQSLPPGEGGIVRGDKFFFACDLRPSASRFVPEEDGRGELAQAIARAVADAGMDPVFLGRIPTPALAHFALQRRKGGIMITGSHIPFDRNGYKTNSAKGELLKKDEAPIQQRSEEIRARLYAQPAAESLFDERGMFKCEAQSLPPADDAAGEEFLCRYTGFFAGASLKGKRILVYEHSAVGRDLLVELLQRFGAEAVPAGRSETFVPIDTENIGEAELAQIQSLVEGAVKAGGPVDAVVSTDGDSDRPLVLGVTNRRVRFFGGDLVGMIVAEYLGADAVVVPISCNDAVDRGALRNVLEPKTRIGSPFVIAGMEAALAKGRKAVCGWEANGGFLTGSDICRRGRTLAALPTRDAFLPILSVLLCAAEKGVAVSDLFDALPRRFSRAALLRNFPRSTSLKIIRRFSPADEQLRGVNFTGTSDPALLKIRGELGRFFSPELGFGAVEKADYTDGVRIYFAGGDIAHIRPSGNADELRIYAVADTLERAEEIVRHGIAEPRGILRSLEAVVSG